MVAEHAARAPATGVGELTPHEEDAIAVCFRERRRGADLAEDDPFADFIVHEAAHIFHNCKRRTIGLRETRRKEWLLDIEFRQRETFAYSCEAYARIVARAERLER